MSCLIFKDLILIYINPWSIYVVVWIRLKSRNTIKEQNSRSCFSFHILVRLLSLIVLLIAMMMMMLWWWRLITRKTIWNYELHFIYSHQADGYGVVVRLISRNRKWKKLKSLRGIQIVEVNTEAQRMRFVADKLNSSLMSCPVQFPFQFMDAKKSSKKLTQP